MRTVENIGRFVYRPALAREILRLVLRGPNYGVVGPEHDEWLKDVFRLNISKDELVIPRDPNTGNVIRYGRVADIREVTTAENPGPEGTAGCKVMEFEDPFVQSNPGLFQRITEYGQTIESALDTCGYDPADNGGYNRTEAVIRYRKEKESSRNKNRFNRAWRQDAAVNAWWNLIPSSAALSYCTEPLPHLPISYNGSRLYMSSEGAAQLQGFEDPIAIRGRAAAVREIVSRHLGEPENHGQKIQILSLASGMAETDILTAKAAHGKGFDTALTVVDNDGRALRQIPAIAERHGFPQERIKTIKMDLVRHPDVKAGLKELTGVEQYDVVNCTGFLEYMPHHYDEIASPMGRLLLERQRVMKATDLVRYTHELTKPGGISVISNMADERAQIKLLLGVFDWPIINLRSERTVASIYQEAGVSLSEVTFYRLVHVASGVRIYNMMATVKERQRQPLKAPLTSFMTA